jgi:hypothetical protein
MPEANQVERPPSARTESHAALLVEDTQFDCSKFRSARKSFVQAIDFSLSRKNAKTALHHRNAQRQKAPAESRNDFRPLSIM